MVASDSEVCLLLLGNLLSSFTFYYPVSGHREKNEREFSKKSAKKKIKKKISASVEWNCVTNYNENENCDVK